MRVFLCPNSWILRDLLNPALDHPTHFQAHAEDFACNSAVGFSQSGSHVAGTQFAFNSYWRSVPPKGEAE